MRISLFIGGIYGGGAERVMCSLANHLCRKGHEVEIITMSENTEHYALDEGVRVNPLLKNSERRGVIGNYIKRWTRLKKHVKSGSAERYVVMLPVTTIMLLLLAKKTDAPIIAAERAEPSKYSRAKRFLLRKLAPRARLFIFQTEDVKAWYGSSVKRSTVIPNAINEQFLRPVYQGGREPVIIGAGRLTDQKNFELLISAFSKIARDFPDHSVRIFGEGPNRDRILSRAEELSVGDRVFLPGRTDNMPVELEKASLFVLSSDYEGMPNVLIEAMALGVPCVATDCGGGGARFLVQDGENGLLVPIRDASAMADAMRRILSDRALSEKLGENAHAIAFKLDPEVIYGLWEKEITEAGC